MLLSNISDDTSFRTSSYVLIGNYLWSIFLNPFSSPAALPPTHILRRAGKLSQPTWTSQCLTTHYCPSTEDKSAGPLFKDMGNIPNFPTLPPLF